MLFLFFPLNHSLKSFVPINCYLVAGYKYRCCEMFHITHIKGPIVFNSCPKIFY